VSKSKEAYLQGSANHALPEEAMQALMRLAGSLSLSDVAPLLAKLIHGARIHSVGICVASLRPTSRSGPTATSGGPASITCATGQSAHGG
jgi:hypothetical protein